MLQGGCGNFKKEKIWALRKVWTPICKEREHSEYPIFKAYHRPAQEDILLSLCLAPLRDGGGSGSGELEEEAEEKGRADGSQQQPHGQYPPAPAPGGEGRGWGGGGGAADHVISPDFSLELTGFFPGKHLIHFLVLKMKDFRNFKSSISRIRKLQ